MTDKKRLEVSLFLMRLGVFSVMIMWTVDKFVNPKHAAKVFEVFYMINDLPSMMSYAIGSVQLLIVLGFLFGICKRFTYGSLLLLHLVSTVTPWRIYLDPWGSRNLLFFAAFPMLAALIALYLLRDHDKFMTLKK